MSALVIRTDHTSLEQVARLFDGSAAHLRRSVEQVQRRVEVLRGGGWVGEGASAFYREMDSEVFPALSRLAAALDASATATRRINRLFRDAQGEAAAVMLPFGPGSGLHAPASTDSAEAGSLGNSAGMHAFGPGGRKQGATARSATQAAIESLPAGNMRAAALQLLKSKELVDRNTARQVAEGHVKVYYFEDLKQPPDAEAILKKNNLDPNRYRIYLNPDTGHQMLLDKDAAGFASGSTIFGPRSASAKEWQTMLVHETNHIVNASNINNPVERYKSEFRAYWVQPGVRDIADLTKRAEAIKSQILITYPEIQKTYTGPVKDAIDAHTRPDGDLTNQGKLSGAAP
jgi:WXG100 family type VII secretion target